VSEAKSESPWTAKGIATVVIVLAVMIAAVWKMNGANGVEQLLVAGAIGGMVAYIISRFSKKP
jgi:uncharacterized YccA/Bax inhibitor family protein